MRWARNPCAIDELERAYREGTGAYLFVIKVNRSSTIFAAMPRFEALVQNYRREIVSLNPGFPDKTKPMPPEHSADGSSRSGTSCSSTSSATPSRENLAAIPITSASLMARGTRLVIRGEAPAVEFKDIAIDVAASMQLSFYVLPIDP